MTDSIISEDVKSKAISVIPKGWEYSNSKNEAKNTTARVAKTDAVPHGNQIYPYEIFAPSLIIRDDSSKGLDVFISDNQKDFLSNDTKFKYVFASFDEGSEQRWKCNPAAGAADAVFLADAKQFLTKIRSSKFLIFKADMAGNSKSDYKFDLRELQWPIAARPSAAGKVK